MFSGYPWDACSFVKGYGGGVDLGKRGDEAGWEEQKEGTKINNKKRKELIK